MMCLLGHHAYSGKSTEFGGSQTYFPICVSSANLLTCWNCFLIRNMRILMPILWLVPESE